MLNAEKYRDQLLKFVEENHDSLFGLDKNSEPISCAVSRCNNCQFGFKKNNYIEGYSCSAAKIKWLLSEYREPVKLTRFEQDILKHILEKTQYRFIVREKSDNIYIYKRKPKKGLGAWDISTGMQNLNIFVNLFPFIKWEDSEPTSIQDVLDKCEVVESDL